MKLLLSITYSNFFYFFQNSSKGFCQLLRLYDRRVTSGHYDARHIDVDFFGEFAVLVQAVV